MTDVFDVARARRETRGCENTIHFNNAGASLPPAPVTDALYGYLRDEELHGGYEIMAERAGELDNFYTASAKLLNCSASEIAYTDSATRAWAAAFYAFDFQPGDRILIGSAEYGSNLVALLHQAARRGVDVIRVPDEACGQTDVVALEKLIDNKTRLICLTHVPSGGGLVNPAVEVGRLAKAAGIPYLLDACQSMGQMPLDVEQIGCDVLCGTGRKFLRGPRGTGLLYVREALLEQLEPSQLNHHASELLTSTSYRLRSDARRFECWERSYAGQLALGVAIDYALHWGLEAISQRVRMLAETLRKDLAAIDGVSLADRGVEQCGIVTFSVDGVLAGTLQLKLAEKGVNVSTVPFSANPIDTEKRHSPPLLRVSPHYYNTLQETDKFLAEIELLLKRA